MQVTIAPAQPRSADAGPGHWAVDDVRDVDRGHRVAGLRRKGGRTARALTALATHAGIPGAARVTPHAPRHAAITLALGGGRSARPGRPSRLPDPEEQQEIHLLLVQWWG